MPPTDPAAPWLSRYLRPLPLRSRGAFHLVSAERESDGERCVVVVPGPGSDASLIGAAFAEIARVHALLDDPRIPAVTARGEAEGAPFLELDCDAVIDASEGLRRLADGGRKVPYEAADGFIASLRGALQAAHAARDPRSGAPVCLGRLSLSNVLFSPDGRHHLLGFGRNFPIEKESGALDGLVTIFQAPELWTGSPPSPMGDFAALLLFMRSLMPFVEMKEPLAHLFRGEIGPADLPLIELFQWFDRHVLSQAPPLRPTMAEAIAVSDQIRAALGVTPDPRGFAALVASVIERQERASGAEGDAPRAEPPVLEVDREITWFVGPDGEKRRLGRAPRRILSALIEQHRAEPGAPLSLWTLLEAGWPGEQPVVEAGANRVYVTLARMRSQGLRAVIDRFDDGYRLSPRTVLRLSPQG